MEKQKILVIGCCGKMGRTICNFINSQSNYELVGGIDVSNVGEKIEGITVCNDLKKFLNEKKVDVAIDFTMPSSVVENAITCLRAKTPIIIGTTGISNENKKMLGKLASDNQTGIMIIPNFAIGAILMMEFSKIAAKYMKAAEIIELHHDQKKDKPSGTSIKTRSQILEAKNISIDDANEDTIPIHSVRLPGLVAHQEVIFGDIGQTLTIRHDSFNRESFMPGIAIALEQIKKLKGLQEKVLID